MRNVLVELPMAGLSRLGRYGTGAVAASLVLGTLMPTRAATVAKPLLTEAVFIMLCITFLRMDTDALSSYIRKPKLVAAAFCWTSLIIPLIMGFTGLALDLHQNSSALFLGILLQAIASPIMSAPALASLMGIEGTLILVTLVISTALVPLSAPVFAFYFAGSALTIPPFILAKKLFFILTGALVAGFSLRKIIGIGVIRRHSHHFDGINILLLLLFATAIMDNVLNRILTTPLTMLIITLVGMTVFLLILFSTMLVFLPAGKEQALPLGFMSANRNMGLMLAATGGVLPEATWLYLAMSQIPIYFSPHLIKLTARLLKKKRQTNCKPSSTQ